MTIGRAAEPSSSPVGTTRRRLLGALAALPFLSPNAGAALRDAAAEDAHDNCARECRKKHKGHARRRCKNRCTAGRVCVPAGERGCNVPGGFCCDGDCENDVCVCPVNSIPVDGVCASCDVCWPTGCAFTSFQQAVDATDPGDTIIMCPGIFSSVHEIGAITKSLTVKGAGAGVTVLRSTPEQPGAETFGLTISDSRNSVILLDVTITGVQNTSMQGAKLIGAITNSARLNLYRVEVTGNSTGVRGGGIVNFGTLRLGAGTRVVHNSVFGTGGGVLNLNTLIREPRSEITQNTPSQCIDYWGGTGC